jgi:hypothetical protein
LLAYQKICNDHYTYRQWQPYDASLCNIDYLQPLNSCSDNYMDSTEFKLMRSQEISNFNKSVKHRQQVDLINNSLYL